MKSTVFTKVLLAVVGVCLALTIAHLIYVCGAYPNGSIIYFIAKELW